MFMEFADGKFGRVPLSKIYSNYQNLSSKQQKAIEEAVKKAKEDLLAEIAKGKSTPGSLGTPGAGDGDIFSKEELDRHKNDTEWWTKNYDKASKSLKFYNKK